MGVSDSALTTKQAARLLNVSEATVRRWGDAGLIPVKRVGRRRGARRFADKDLERFREHGRTVTPGAGGAEDADTFAAGRAVLRLHDHVATFYDSEDGRRGL